MGWLQTEMRPQWSRKPTGAQRCDLNASLWQPSPVSKWCSLTERLFCRESLKAPNQKGFFGCGNTSVELTTLRVLCSHHWPWCSDDSLSSKNLFHNFSPLDSTPCWTEKQESHPVHSDGSYHLGLPSIYWALSPRWVFWTLAKISRSSEGLVHINLVNKTKWV